MDLGQFSVSLTVKDMQKSYDFYKTLGFKAIPNCGSIGENWLILQNGPVVIGIFKDMFPKNLLTFNPKDARSIQKHLKDNGIAITKECEEEGSGPAHFALEDPDGNQILIDQHE